MKSSDLTLFREICDGIDNNLYNTLQMPDDEFKDDVESGEYFKYLPKNSIEYDFEDREEKLGVSLRYYQRLALYFTKYYFEKKYLIGGNENNKLTYWMATGSGKTVIMKANIIDYFEYLRDKNPSEIEVIITSPLKELIGQLQSEMGEFFSDPFFRDFKFSYKIETTQGLISRYENESHEIVGESQYRLLLVDEAHIGLGTSEKGAFVKLRDDLTQNSFNSFMFEYSATFYDVKNQAQIDEYAQRIVFEYDYGKFYSDRYGKDFKFGVVKKDAIAEDENKDIKRNLDTNIKEFSKKLKAFENYNKIVKKEKQFEDRPLLIMAGNTVSASNEDKAENQENSDIAKIIGYFAELKNLKNYNDVFNSDSGVLHLLQNSSSDGEILLTYGEDSSPFGLITVGNVKKFLENSNIQKLVSENKIILKTVKFTNENYLFKNIDFSTSPINILIGSRKFSAGWNSFRASQICLINFGTGSGSTIIQMFGRGVRLKGIDKDGKRQEDNYVDETNGEKHTFLEYSKRCNTSEEKYEQLKYLETLFIYSLRSTYLSKFIEEDTDIYKKSISFIKKIEVIEKEQRLPIFYVDKTFLDVENEIICNVEINGNELFVEYEIDKNKKSTSIDLPIRLNLHMEEEITLKYDDFKNLLPFVDRAYFQRFFEKKEQKNNIIFQNIDIDYIIELLQNKKIEVIYDAEIITPIQIQKLLIKISNTLISKIVNKIKYVENSHKYKFKKIVTPDDYALEYNIKFTLDEQGKLEEVRKRLEKDDNYKVFTKKILNHYYQPLAIDPASNTKEVYDTFQLCGYPELTQNMKNIVDCYDAYFKNIESIKITPDKLNQYEFKFLCDLQKYIAENKLNAIILRNKSNGNIGITSNTDDGVFYPDFIIWHKDNEEKEHLIFCDPKGIRNSETEWKVCGAPYEVKNIENEWSEDITIHSFIISNTKLKDISWRPIKFLSIEECDKFFNLVFFDDEEYIKRIFMGLNTDILLHSIFQKHIDHFDKNTIEEWLDDTKRKKHLNVIQKIQTEEDIDEEKAMLLYFIVWEKRDKLKDDQIEEIFQDTKGEITNKIIEEIVGEGLNSIIPGAKIGYKVLKLIVEHIKQ